jgi:hypothetical protein
MKLLEVKKIGFETPYPDLSKISDKLDMHRARNSVGEVNWNKFPYRPDVTFSMGYTRSELLLKYYITEDYFKAEKTLTNDAVYEDSCVEFFISPGNDDIYYNLEFNGIGTCLMGAGADRKNRTRISPEVIGKIRRITSVGKKPVSEREVRFSWKITIAIPFQVFLHHEIKNPEGKTFRANFYKCGDGLKVPHYLTWNPVGTEKPDFHQPVFFGQLAFV